MALTKPDLKDAEIIACLQDSYGLDVMAICFLPLGADFNTAVYRVTTSRGEDYFLKLRSGDFFEASLSVTKYLAHLGIKQIIPPFVTKTGQLWKSLESFKAILYPYIDGHNGVESQLSEAQWTKFGATIKKLHSADISLTIKNNIPQETFFSKWHVAVETFLARIENEVFDNPVAARTAEFLKSKRTEILKIVARAENLARDLQKQRLEYLLCHADIHGWNLLIDKEGAFYIVDWDTLILAPKERDLMFIGAGIWDSGRTPTEEESLFYQGYGPTNINQDAICYYRYARIIDDIGEYCEHIFLTGTDGDDRAQSFEYLQSHFRNNGTIERAYQSDKAR